MLAEKTVQNFITDLASDTPVPGGGSVAALCGANAAALIAMVCSLTIGKKGYEDAWEELKPIKEKAEVATGFFLEAMDKDANAYSMVIDCFKMPKEGFEEKELRTNAIQDATLLAAMVPLKTAEKAVELFEMAEVVVKKGNKNASSDGAVAAMMIRNAILGALYNVRINADSLKEEETRNMLLERSDALEAKAKEWEKTILGCF